MTSTDIENREYLYGYGSDDTITGTTGVDIIHGFGGNDTITTMIGDGTAAGTEAWYTNSVLNANLAINADAGNDTIHNFGGGDWVMGAVVGLPAKACLKNL